MRVSIKFASFQNLLFTSNSKHIYSIHVFALSIDLERRDSEILLPVCISKQWSCYFIMSITSLITGYAKGK